MPSVQSVRGPSEFGETGSRIDEIGVISVVTSEVLAPEAETRLPGQPTRCISGCAV